jgi:hypothetical protein
MQQIYSNCECSLHNVDQGRGLSSLQLLARADTLESTPELLVHLNQRYRQV